MAKIEKVFVPEVHPLLYSSLREERSKHLATLSERDVHPDVEEFIIQDLKPVRKPKPFYSLMDASKAVMLFDKETNCLRKSIFNSPEEARDMCSLLRHAPDKFTLIPVQVVVKRKK